MRTTNNAISLNSALGGAMEEMRRQALGNKRPEPKLEMNPQKAFQNFKNGVFQMISPEVQREHFSLFELEKIDNDKMTVRIKSNLNYEFMQAEVKGVLKSLFNTQLSHLAKSFTYVIDKPKRAFMDRGTSMQNLTKALEEAQATVKMNAGVATTARELLGHLISFWQSKTNHSVKAIYLPHEGSNVLHFRFSTSYSGFKETMKPKICSKRTIKEHISRLMESGILLEQKDGVRRNRATTVDIIFNPKIISYKY